MVSYKGFGEKFLTFKNTKVQKGDLVAIKNDGVAEKANLLDDNGELPNAKGALMADAVGTCVGACLGVSTVTSYVESSAGVSVGGRRGIGSVVTAI